MGNVNIKFNNKDYLLSCDDGQEENLKELAKYLDSRFEKIKEDLGNIGENKILLITIIKIIDEFFDLKKKVTSTKKDFEKLSLRFKEIKSLAINYKDEKESEINKLKNQVNEFEKLVIENQNSYEKMLDKTTQSIDEFIEGSNPENKLQ